MSEQITSQHMHISIRGALAMSKKEFSQAYKGVFSNDDGSPMTVAEARAEMQKELALGHEIIPSKGCDNFDWVKGCRGHVREAKPELERIEVKIIGAHPHTGENGYLNVVDGHLSQIRVGQGTMFDVILEDCTHGMERCYAVRSEIRIKNIDALKKMLAQEVRE